MLSHSMYNPLHCSNHTCQIKLQFAVSMAQFPATHHERFIRSYCCHTPKDHPLPPGITHHRCFRFIGVHFVVLSEHVSLVLRRVGSGWGVEIWEPWLRQSQAPKLDGLKRALEEIAGSRCRTSSKSSDLIKAAVGSLTFYRENKKNSLVFNKSTTFISKRFMNLI